MINNVVKIYKGEAKNDYKVFDYYLNGKTTPSLTLKQRYKSKPRIGVKDTEETSTYLVGSNMRVQYWLLRDGNGKPIQTSWHSNYVRREYYGREMFTIDFKMFDSTLNVADNINGHMSAVATFGVGVSHDSWYSIRNGMAVCNKKELSKEENDLINELYNKSLSILKSHFKEKNSSSLMLNILKSDFWKENIDMLELIDRKVDLKRTLMAQYVVNDILFKDYYSTLDGTKNMIEILELSDNIIYDGNEKENEKIKKCVKDSVNLIKRTRENNITKGL